MDARVLAVLVFGVALLAGLGFGARRLSGGARPVVPPAAPAPTAGLADWPETVALEAALRGVEDFYPERGPTRRPLYHPTTAQVHYDHIMAVLADARTPVRWRRLVDALRDFLGRIRIETRSSVVAEDERLGALLDRLARGAPTRVLEDSRDIHLATLDLIDMGVTTRFRLGTRSQDERTLLDLRWAEIHESVNQLLQDPTLWEPGFPEFLYLIRAGLTAWIEPHGVDDDLEGVTRLYARRAEGPWKTRYQVASLDLLHKARLAPRKLCRLKAEHVALHLQRLGDPGAALAPAQRAELAAQLAGTNLRSKLECGEGYGLEDEAQLMRLLELVRQQLPRGAPEVVHQLWRARCDLDALVARSRPPDMDRLVAPLTLTLKAALEAAPGRRVASPEP